MQTLFTILAAIVALYGLVAIINNRTTSKKKSFAKPSFFVGISVFLILLCLVRIPAQEVGVLVTPRGVSESSLKTGWHFTWMWNKVFRMDKTAQVYTMCDNVKEGTVKDADAVWCPTKDGIKMGIDISISWRINPDKAWWIYDNISEMDNSDEGRYDWIEENIIRAKTKSILALTVSKYTPIEVYSTSRSDIENEVCKSLKTEMETSNLILDKVSIREVTYNKEYEAAINSKKLAEQEALRLIEVTKQKEENLKQAKIMKDSVIVQAEGEAKALTIKGEAVTANPNMVKLNWIEKWNGVMPVYMLGSDSKMLITLPTSN